MEDINYFWKVFNHVNANSVEPYIDGEYTEYFMNDVICRSTPGNRMGRVRTQDEWKIITPHMLAVINYQYNDDVVFLMGELSDLIALHDSLFLSKAQV